MALSCFHYDSSFSVFSNAKKVRTTETTVKLHIAVIRGVSEYKTLNSLRFTFLLYLLFAVLQHCAKEKYTTVTYLEHEKHPNLSSTIVYVMTQAMKRRQFVSLGTTIQHP